MESESATTADMKICEYDGFTADRIIKAFLKITDVHKKNTLAWIIMRGPKIKKPKTGYMNKAEEKATAASVALGKAGATFGQISTIFGAGFAYSLHCNNDLPVRCKAPGIPRLLAWTSIQYMSVNPEL